MIDVIYVITPDRLNADNSVKLFASDGVTTYYDRQPDGSFAKSRPCQNGDVLSIQPDGTLQGREQAYGVYELPRISSKGLVYSPSGTSGKSWLIPYAD